MSDPLGGYTTDWRKRIQSFADVASGSSTTADPLAGYTPNWRDSLPQVGPDYAAPAPADVQGVVSGAFVPETPETSTIPAERAADFQAWLRKNQVHDLDNPQSYYDYRGAFLAGVDRDPASGHWPDTFKQHGERTFSTQSQYSTGPDDGGTWDPLDNYTPDWKQRVAQAVFGDVPDGEVGDREHQPADLAMMRDIAATAGEGVNETPFQSAYRKLARVGRQAAASVPEQVVGGAEALARTGALLSNPAGIEVYGKGGEIERLAQPALEASNELAGGAPQGPVEQVARMIGPAGIYGLGKGAAEFVGGKAAEAAAGAASDELLGRIHEAPRIGDEAQAYRLDEALTEPRTPNTEAVTSFQDALAQTQAERAAQEARQAARINQPRSPIARAIEDFDRERYAAQANVAEGGQPAPSPELPPQPDNLPPVETTGDVTPPLNQILEPGDAAGSDLRESRTGEPNWLPDPLAHEPAKGPTELRNARFAKMDDQALLARRNQIIDRIQEQTRVLDQNVTQFSRERDWGGKVVGTSIKNAGGRAIGRMKDDGRILEELDKEIRVRGITEDEAMRAYDAHSEGGGISLHIPPAIAGAAAGGAAGSQADPEHPGRGILLGALAGTVLGVGAKSLGKFSEAYEGRRGLKLEPSERPTPPEPETPVHPEDYVNPAKFALDEGGTERLKTEVTRIVQEQGIHPKEPVSWQETRAIANQIGVGDLPREELNTRLNGPEMLAIRNVVSTNLDSLERLYGRIKELPAGDPELKRIDRSIGYLEQQNDHLLGRFIRNRTQTGRDLNNLKILANRVMDPFTWIAKAANVAESAGKKLTPEQAARIRELVQADDREGLVGYIAGLRPSSPGSQALTLWKTGLLTNPKTHIANILGNTAMAGLETAKDVPAALIDRILSLGTGQRTKSFSPVGVAQATWKGAKAGAAEAMDILRHGTPPDLSRWDIPTEVTFKNPILRAYTETIRRGLAAPDAFFRKLALHRALGEAERLGPLTEEASLQAVADAEYAVFQGGGRVPGEQSRLARIGEAVRREAGPAGHIVAPFTRTPGNVISATIDYSPFGAIRGARDVYRLIKAVKANASPAEIQFLQKAASQQLGRTITGSLAPFVAGVVLARNGLMTGARPSSPAEQDQWNLAGKQENAVRLGNKWWSLNRLSPVGNLMALGANYELLRRNPEAGIGGAIAGTAGSIGTTATEQSFLQGVQQVQEAIKDPVGQAGRYGKNLAASVVPSAVGALARTMDPTIRDTRGGFLDALKSRIPELSKQLPAEVDQLGRTKTREGGAVGQFLDPGNARSYRLDDPVIAELEKTGTTLGDLGQGRARPSLERKLESALRNAKSPYTRALLERRLEQEKGGEDRSRFLVRSEKEGRALDQVLTKVIQNQNYRRLPVDAQKDVLEAVIEKVRRQLTRRLRQ